MRKITLDIGQFELYDNYIIGTPALGVDMNEKACREILLITKKHYKNKEIAYIANRIHHNSVDPMIYKAVEKNLPNLKYMAVISYSESTERVVDYEKCFTQNLHLRSFPNLHEAKSWIQHKLSKKSKKEFKNCENHLLN